MLRALFSGVSGMKNHQTRIDVIGNNIANVNTTGFKSGRVNFADQVSQLALAASAPGGTGGDRGGVNPQQVGLGMLTASIDTVMTQGNLQTTGKITDLAIQGDGFFITSDGPNRYYTRAGNFDFDREGFLVNPSNGLKVMGWNAQQKIDAAGEPYYEIDHSAPIGNISVPAGAVIPPRRTTEIIMKGNLDERIPTVAPTQPGDPLNYFDTSSEIYDSLGNQHFVTVRFTHVGPGEWTWQIQPAPGQTIANNAANPPQTLRFGDDGLLIDQTATTPPSPGQYNGGAVDISWTLDSTEVVTTTLTPNFGTQLAAGGMTQFATASTAVVADQNGYTRGELVGITIDKSGTANGVFSNGRQQLLGQVALATFTNPGGLMKEGENTYIKTTNSGDAIIRYAGQAEAGLITSGALEMSNVDLAQQFSDMIITQRGFQASSRVITTSDEVLQELINLKR
ncbi:MAG: flagellar hook protein FlgE [Candidatus Sericytochromatia bacterium]